MPAGICSHVAVVAAAMPGTQGARLLLVPIPLAAMAARRGVVRVEWACGVC